jgi:hypothetical protein
LLEKIPAETGKEDLRKAILEGPQRKAPTLKVDETTGKVRRYHFRSEGAGNPHPLGKKKAEEKGQQKKVLVLWGKKRNSKRKYPYNDTNQVSCRV